MSLLDPYDEKRDLVKDALENARVTYEKTYSGEEVVIVTEDDAEAEFIRIYDEDDGFAAKETDRSREELVEHFDSKSHYERRDPIGESYLVSIGLGW